jgi:hypoxanthine phosphoribosyltransferase
MSTKKTFSPIPRGRTLIASSAIQRRVRELGARIRSHYKGRNPVLLGLMNGALFFLADLLRTLPASYEVRCASVRSYSGKASTGKILGLSEIQGDFAEREVVLIDDVLDTGLTLAEVRKRLLILGAKRVEICVFLRKRKRRTCAVRPRWVGFDIADEFVIGYGLDYNGLYRGIKSVRVME